MVYLCPSHILDCRELLAVKRTTVHQEQLKFWNLNEKELKRHILIHGFQKANKIGENHSYIHDEYLLAGIMLNINNICIFLPI